MGIEPLTKENVDQLDAGLQFKGGILLTDAQIQDFKLKFDRFDTDGSGNISTKEVGDVLKDLGHDVAHEIVQVLVNEIDLDHSGEINFDEFCTLMTKMLGPDGKVDVEGYMKHMSDAAAREAKQNQIVEMFPAVQEEVKEHKVFMDKESVRLDGAFTRVDNIEQDQAELVKEVAKLRKCLELNQDYWKGLSRGLKETKRTVHTEGDGEMLPSAIRLRNALPPLLERPATHSGGRSAR